MYANRITITEVQQLAKDIYGDCTIDDCNGLYKVQFGHGQVIYANDKFIDELHEEMLKQVFTKKFENTYNKYYRNEN